jgi:hypothetical protein
MTIRIPLRASMLYKDAKKLAKLEFFTQAILSYCQYLEQILLISYLDSVESKDPLRTRKELDKLMKMKDSGQLTFGNILRIAEKTIVDPTSLSYCRQIKRIRDTLAAHLFFVAIIDKANRTKRGFYDVNNHRKMIRRLYKLARQEKLRIQEVESFLHKGSPFVMMSTIEESSYEMEKIILSCLCDRIREKLEFIESTMNIPRTYNLEYFFR